MRAFGSIVMLLTFVLAGALIAQDPADPFMGDWQGALRDAAGKETPLCAQVICWGREGYQANLLPEFDRRVPPIAVLKGSAVGGKLTLGEAAEIEGGVFAGELTGEHAGTFRLEQVERLSPTLGAQPPEGAIVLFDGTNLDQWQGGRIDPSLIDLRRLVGGDDRAAYLRCRITTRQAQPALLELGSDDGIKVWLNGALVHQNNASRPCRPWEDQVEIELEAGENVLLLKVLQGGGDWSACARLRSREGTGLPGLTFDPQPALDLALAGGAGGDPGTIVTWDLAGPFSQEGKAGPELFDVVFPPEEDAPEVEWTVVNDQPASQYRWKLLGDGAMEIAPGSGALVCKPVFGDFQLHMEFRLPFEPDARGQGRANSGVYLQGRWEVQLLDSYGLEGRDNECGGMYSVKAPDVNMCAPPLQWQTYDIQFQGPRTDPVTGQATNPRMTVLHNGVVIHQDVEITVPSTPGGAGEPAGLLLQDHGNPLQFRNIWVVETQGP